MGQKVSNNWDAIELCSKSTSIESTGLLSGKVSIYCKYTEGEAIYLITSQFICGLISVGIFILIFDLFMQWNKEQIEKESTLFLADGRFTNELETIMTLDTNDNPKKN